MPILLSKDYRASIESVEEEILRRLERRETGTFVYVVPTKRKLRDLHRRLLHAIPGGASSELPLFTLETLAGKLHTACCPPKHLLSGPAQSVVLRQAVVEVADKLRYFRFRGTSRWLPSGTLDRILNVINALKEKGVYPALLYAEVEASEVQERAKLTDILTIYEEYEKRLGDSLIDAGGIFKEVNRDWNAAAFGKLFGEVDSAFVSGFDEFSDPEMTLLYHLANQKGIGSVVEFDYDEGNPDLFGHLEENYKKFIEIGFRKIARRSPKQDSLMSAAVRHLFRQEASPKRLAQRNRIAILHATDRRGEVETIAREIKKQAAESPGRDLSKICVALYRPQVYTALVREVFDRYGIPANITDRYSLDQSPLVVAILALLDVRRNDFRVNDIMRALTSPYFRIDGTIEGPDAGSLYETAVRLKIAGGLGVWKSRIRQRLEVIERELRDTPDEINPSWLLRERMSLEAAVQNLSALAKHLDAFSRPMSPQEFKERLVALLRQLNVASRILENARSEDAAESVEKDSRAYQKFLDFLDDFVAIVRMERKGVSAESLEYYVEQLRTALPHVRYNVRQRYGYGVLVTSFEETRGLKFDIMYIAGLVDGEFPPPYQPEIFFTSPLRARQERYHLTKHRYLFYQALTNFTQRLLLLFPARDGDVELVPSSFMGALLRIADIDDRKVDTAQDQNEVLCSPDELLIQCGRLAAQGADLANVELEKAAKSLGPAYGQLQHTFAVERSRSVAHDKPEYEGEILGSLAPTIGQEVERLKEEVFSVTQLESYGVCPFKYFSERMLGLQGVEEVEEGLTPLEKGLLLHEILFEFYIDRRNRNLPPVFNSSEKEYQEAVTTLLDIAGRKISLYTIDDPFWEVEKEHLLGTPQRRGLLHEFLSHERERILEVAPSWFELAFGSRTGSKLKTDPAFRHPDPVEAGNVRIRGKVDRVDAGNGMFSIIDYKTGSHPTKKDLLLGTSLQLPVYLFAIEKMIAAQQTEKARGVGGVYYTVKSPIREAVVLGDIRYRGKALPGKPSGSASKSDEDMNTTIQRAIQFVNEYVGGISKGKFPVRPQRPKDACPKCDFLTICRVQTQASFEPVEQS